MPGEGKTTAVANLAVSFARAGQRVIVISCDLRRPRIHEFFGLRSETGLTSVLIGQAPLSDAILAVEGEPRLRVIPSGPVPPNPAEILSLKRVEDVVEVLGKNGDIVLLDCPPVLPVTDALLLSRLVDGILVVASAKSTSRRDLHRSIELLHQVQAPVLGTILNRVPVDGSYAYGYGGYGYYDRYYEEPRREAKMEAPVGGSGNPNGATTSTKQSSARAKQPVPNGSTPDAPSLDRADPVPGRTPEEIWEPTVNEPGENLGVASTAAPPEPESSPPRSFDS